MADRRGSDIAFQKNRSDDSDQRGTSYRRHAEAVNGMKDTLWLVLRELRHDKRRAVLLGMTVALAESSLYAILTLSAGYLRFFGEQAAQAGKDAVRLALQGMADVGKMLLGLVFQLLFKSAAALQLTAGEMLSGEAALKNLPAFILLSGLTALIAVRCAAGLLFSVYRRRHRHFLTSLLVGGADAGFVDRFILTEALCVWAFAAPAAVLLGIAETLALRHFATVFFCRSVGVSPPVVFRGSILCALVAGFSVLWIALRGFRKSGRGLSVKNAARELRRYTGALLGFQALTGEPLHYRILGLPHYIAMRNIEDRLGRYLKIFLMTTVYLSDVGFLLMVLTLARNSAAEGGAGVPCGEVFFSANAFFFCASAVITQIIATAGTVCGMISNIVSNTSEYAQLRASGTSMRVIRRCARREGALCVLIGLWVGVFWFVSLFSMFVSIYGPMTSGNGIDFTGAGKPLIVLGVFSLIHMAAVFAAVCFACRKVNRIDLLQELKELAYS